MKDPRKDLYSFLEEHDKTDLMADTKSYFSGIITKDDSLSNVQVVQDKLDALQGKYDEVEKERDTLKSTPAPDTGGVSAEKFNALDKAFKELKDENDRTKADASNAHLTTKLTNALGKIPEELRAGALAGLKSETGYSIGGKTFRAVNDNGTVKFEVDKLDTAFGEGVEALLGAGLSKYVSGEAGGGFPSFDNTDDKKAQLSFDDDINAEL